MIDLNRLHNLATTAREQLQAHAPAARTGQSWYRIENADKGLTDVYIYEMIGDWGVSAQQFVNDLRAVTSSSIALHVNSEGGEVFDGLAIYESLVRHPADVTAHVEGIAASAASFIVMAANRIVMAPRARMMIHDASGIVMGNSRDMIAMAQLLDDLSNTIADIYAERGGSRAQWRQAMQAASGGPDGSWYDAQQAVDAGLADEIGGAEDGTPAPRKATARADVTGLNKIEREYVSTDPEAGLDRSLIDPAPLPRREPTWDPGAFLEALVEVDEYEPPAPIPDGEALRTLFDHA